MTSKFNEDLAGDYRQLRTTNPFYLYVETDSVLHYAGDVRGKRILDLGCGEGFICRTLKKKGAELVIGVDISEYMIKMAKEEEDKEPLGIDYLVQDVRTMKKIGEFDIVLGNLFLCFMENQKELEMVANVIYENLKIGGRFISFSPDLTRTKWSPDEEKLSGLSLKKLSDVPNGHWATVENHPSYPSKYFIKILLLHPKIYRQVFINAGFLDLSFHCVYLTEESMKLFPESYWSPLWNDKIFKVIIGCK